jgi:integration host factor subunit alpha
MTVLTKAELVKILLKKMPSVYNKQTAVHFIEAFFEEIATALEKGEEVKLAGLGNFMIRHKKPRIGRNPKTGEETTISARHVVTFRSSLKLKNKISAVKK